MKTRNQWLFEAPLPSTIAFDSKPEAYEYSMLEDETEPLFEIPAIAATVPTLLFTEPIPAGLTLYVKIPLGGEGPAQPITGIFIPPNYTVASRVDLILYLHGYHTSPVIKGKKPAPGYTPVTLSIHQHWNATLYPYFALREGMSASGKNAILVAPTLGPKSQAGNLLKPGGLDTYLNQVMASLKTYGPHRHSQQVPTIVNIILACHSGGGYPMRQLALSKSAAASHIKECWGFDCTYNTGDDIGWARWAKLNSSSRLFIYYIANSQTAPLATRLEAQAKRQKLSNVFVGKSSTRSHNKVPITYWKTRIQAASLLRNR